MSFRVEEGPETPPMTCDHCGRQFDMVHGFIYDDQDAHAVYHVVLFDHHPGDSAAVALSLGDWSEGATAADRYRVALEVWDEDDRLNYAIRDREDSPWEDSDTFGRFLRRDEAVQAADKTHWFHLAEHILRDDARVARFWHSSG